MDRYDAVLTLPERKLVAKMKEYPLDEEHPLIEPEQKLVEAHKNLIHTVISTLFGYIPYNHHNDNPSSFDRKDLEQAGMIGIMKSVRTYNPEKAMFSTHAFYQIRKCISDFILKDRTIQITPYAQSQKRNFNKIRLEQEAALGRPVNDYEAAEYAGVPYENYIMFYNPAHIWKNFESYDQDIENLTGSSSSYTPDEAFTHDEDLQEKITQALDGLKKRDREIIIAYYGILGHPKLSAEEIAQQHNISKERIRQLVQNTVKLLRYSPAFTDLEELNTEESRYSDFNRRDIY